MLAIGGLPDLLLRPLEAVRSKFRDFGYPVQATAVLWCDDVVVNHLQEHHDRLDPVAIQEEIDRGVDGDL
jgi:hypothetical protein